MTWGTNTWGTSHWGGFIPGVLGGASPELVNSRPYPNEVTPTQAVVGGTDSIKLGTNALGEEDAYKGYYLVHFGASRVQVRQIAAYSEDKVCTMDDPYAYAIGTGDAVYVYPTDEWVTDLLYMGLRPNLGKRIVVPSIRMLHLFGNSSMDGFRRHTSLGNPLLAHEGTTPSPGAEDWIILSTTEPTVDAYKGLVVRLKLGDTVLQSRKIVRYDPSTKKAYTDKNFAPVPSINQQYEVVASPQVEMHSLEGPSISGVVSVDASHAGIILDKVAAGTTQRGAYVIKKFGASYYRYLTPIQLQAYFTILSASLTGGRAGISFGFAIRGAPDLGIQAEVMHNGGPGELILRVTGPSGALQDYVLIGSADPNTITNLSLDITLIYDPSRDKLFITVFNPVPPPNNALLVDGEFAGVLSSGGFRGSHISGADQPLAYFAAGTTGATARVQYHRFAFLHEGTYPIRDGLIQGFRDGDVLSANGVQTEKELLPLQWHKPWRPIANGRRYPPKNITVTRETITSDLLIKRAAGAAPYLYGRKEIQLRDILTGGFLYTFKMRGEYTEIQDVQTGIIAGAVIGDETDEKEIRVALLVYNGYKYVGIKKIGGDDTQLDGYLSARYDWEESTTFRLAFDPAQGTGHAYLALFVDGDTQPLLKLVGAATSLLSDALTAPFIFPGFYHGLRAVETKATMQLDFARYIYSMVSYVPQLFYNNPVPPEPDTHSGFPWQKQGTAAGYDLVLNNKLQPIDGRVKIETTPAEASYYHRNLGIVSPDHVLRQTDGFTTEFRVQVSGTPKHRDSLSTKGIWTGTGVVVDDGHDRLLLGFAEGGARGKFIFVAGPDPDTGDPLAWGDIQTWVESAIREPRRWRNHIYSVDWSQEHMYRVERTAAITADRNAWIKVYVDDERDPIIELPFIRGSFMDGSDSMDAQPGSIPRIVWGQLTEKVETTSYWREVMYAVAIGFDLHVNQEFDANYRANIMVDSENPSLAAFTILAEES